MFSSLARFTLWALLAADTAGGTTPPLLPAARTQPVSRTCFYTPRLAEETDQAHWPLPCQFWTQPAVLKAGKPVSLVPHEPGLNEFAVSGWEYVGLGQGGLRPLAELFDTTDPFHLDSRPAPREFDGKASARLEGPWGSLEGKMEVESAARELHGREGDHWQAEEALQVPVAGPLYVFGKVNYGYNTWTAQQMTFSGRSGVGCKLQPIQGGEIVLTGGSVLNHQEDPLQPRRLPQEKSQLIVELQARYSLLGALKLEYQGSATPALDPLDHNRVQHDVRLALPLGQAGDVHVGAKHQWEDLPGPPRPWTDGMQLYLGVGLKR
jgi:hypothetical protein